MTDQDERIVQDETGVQLRLGLDLVGSLTWHDIGSRCVVDSVWVDPAHRRRGIAQRLWRLAQEQRPHIEHSTHLSAQGRAWARSTS